MAQCIGSFIICAATFAVAMAVFGVLNVVGLLRISKEGELEGMDLHEHGISAYPEYVISALAAPSGMARDTVNYIPPSAGRDDETGRSREVTGDGRVAERVSSAIRLEPVGTAAIADRPAGRAVQPLRSKSYMKMIVAIIRPEKVEAVQAALSAREVYLMTASDVRGCGRQRGFTEQFRGGKGIIRLLSKVKLEIAVNDEYVEPAVEAIMKAAQSEPGNIGDGKIFVLPLEECYRIRTGEERQRRHRAVKPARPILTDTRGAPPPAPAGFYTCDITATGAPRARTPSPAPLVPPPAAPSLGYFGRAPPPYADRQRRGPPVSRTVSAHARFGQAAPVGTSETGRAARTIPTKPGRRRVRPARHVATAPRRRRRQDRRDRRADRHRLGRGHVPQMTAALRTAHS